MFEGHSNHLDKFRNGSSNDNVDDDDDNSSNDSSSGEWSFFLSQQFSMDIEGSGDNLAATKFSSFRQTHDTQKDIKIRPGKKTFPGAKKFSRILSSKFGGQSGSTAVSVVARLI